MINWIAYVTLVRKELKRIARMWSQVLLTPLMTTFLYFVIFGHVIGSRVGTMAGVSYMQYIAPGLIIMNLITSSYSAAVGAFFIVKFQRSIEEMLVAPMSDAVIVLGFMTAGIVRGLIVALMVGVVAELFTRTVVYSWGLLLFVAIACGAVFSLAGILNAIYAEKFDDISLIPTFVLTPLTYLGGVFYTIAILPVGWQQFAKLNPILYIVSSFRYACLGPTVGSTVRGLWVAFIVMLGLIGLFFGISLRLMQRSTRLRS